MTDRPIPLTAIILTLNEAANIKHCLGAVRRVADVAIVDSGSSDATLEIARLARPDVRIFSHPFRDFGEQRNWALDHVAPRHEWVLFVDADEYCTKELLDEIDAFLAEPGRFVGAYIAGRNYFLGRWLKHATLYPSYQLRLLRHGAVRFRKEGHGQREVTSGPLHFLRQGWVHNLFSKGVHDWIDRHNRYSTAEVEAHRALRQGPLPLPDLWSRDPIARRRAMRSLGARIPGRPLMRFLHAYLWRGGFRDGRPGLIYCSLLLAHAVHIAAKMQETRLISADGRQWQEAPESQSTALPGLQ